MKLALAASLLLVAALALAVEVALTPEEKEQCDAQGGCELVSQAWLRQAMREAYEKGRQRGLKTCLSETT